MMETVLKLSRGDSRSTIAIGFISLVGPSVHLIMTMEWHVVNLSTPEQLHTSLAGLLVMVIVNGTAGRMPK